jgi:two-component system sensor histidine kinase KdpD
VVYVRTSSETLARIDADSLRSLTENIRLAKELGAEVVRLEGSDVVAALADFARNRGITHAVFGRTGQTRLQERLRGSILAEFMRAVPEVDVLVVGERHDDEGGEAEP